MIEIGDKVRLAFPEVWCGYGGDISATYTVKAKSEKASFGSGLGVQVEPALQPGHPHGVDVWYDAAHFKSADQ